MSYPFFLTRFAILTFFICSVVGCALPPDDISGQDFVPETELAALRYTSQGMQEVARGRFLQGEMTLRKAQVFTPDSEKISLNLGVALYGQERYDEALALLEPLHKSDPINPSYRLWLAKALIGASAFGEAQKVLEKSIEDFRQLSDLTSVASFARTLANARYRIGDIDEAICASQTALSATPNATEFLRHVKLLLQSGRLKSAEWFLKSGSAYGGSSASTSSIDYQLRLGELEYMQNNIEGAKTALQNILSRGAVTDSTSAYEVKLLTLLVGQKVKALGQSVDLSILDDDRTQQDLLEDPRRNSSPLSLILGSTTQSDNES